MLPVERELLELFIEDYVERGVSGTRRRQCFVARETLSPGL